MTSTPTFPVASLHKMIEALHRAKPQAFVLQIGAMDGVHFDLLHAHLVQGGWTGLLVEPVPDMFRKLQQTYAAWPELRLANCAIADYEGKLTLQRVDSAAVEAGLVPIEALGITSSYTDRGILASDNFRKTYAAALSYIHTIEVPCTTLPRLLDDYKVDAIDIMVVDTEGADWAIAQQLDLTRYRPGIAVLEFTSLTGAEMQACCAHFLAYGYQLAVCEEDNQNLIFYRIR